MCCDGHLSRLCNVLVGFIEDIKTEVPVGELLQQKMSAIAAMDADTDRKRREALTVFEELRIPLAERDAWIEAF
jgi:hypothetical protein